MSFYMHTCIWIQIIYFTVLYEIKTKQQHRTLHSHIYHSHLHPIGMWAWCWATCSVPSLRSYEYIHEHLLSPVLTINIPHRWEIKGLQVVWGKKNKMTSFLLSLDLSKLIKNTQTGVKQTAKAFLFQESTESGRAIINRSLFCWGNVPHSKQLLFYFYHRYSPR